MFDFAGGSGSGFGEEWEWVEGGEGKVSWRYGYGRHGEELSERADKSNIGVGVQRIAELNGRTKEADPGVLAHVMRSRRTRIAGQSGASSLALLRTLARADLVGRTPSAQMHLPSPGTPLS